MYIYRSDRIILSSDLEFMYFTIHFIKEMMQLSAQRMFALNKNKWDSDIPTLTPVTRIHSKDNTELILDEKTFQPIKTKKRPELHSCESIRIHRVISKRELLITNETQLLIIMTQLLILFSIEGRHKQLYPGYISDSLVDRICSDNVRKRVYREMNTATKKTQIINRCR